MDRRRRDRFRELTDEDLTFIFARTDFFELRNLRMTCRRFRELIGRELFRLAYNLVVVEGPIWNFTQTWTENNPRLHQVQAVREEDQTTMIIPIQFNAQESENLAGRIELIIVWRCILLFRFLGQRFVAVNLWTMRYTHIGYDRAGELVSLLTRRGTRVIADPRDTEHNIFAFSHVEGVCSRFFSHHSSGQVPPLYPSMARAHGVHNVTAAEATHDLAMVIPLRLPNLHESERVLLTTMRDLEPIASFMPVTTDDDLFTPRGAEDNRISFVYCNDGYMAIIEYRTVTFDSHDYQLMIGLRFAFYEDQQWLILSEATPEVILGFPMRAGQARVRVIDRFLVNFSFHMTPAPRPRTAIRRTGVRIVNRSPCVMNLRYSLETLTWTSTSTAMPYQPNGVHSATYCSRLRITDN